MGKVLQLQTPEWAIPLMEPSRYKGAWGGRGCVHPDTTIDTPSGQIPICKFSGGLVWSWMDGRKVAAWASAAQSYTREWLYTVALEDGRSIIVTDQHKFLTQRGWTELQDLCASDAVFSQPQKCDAFHPQSILDNVQIKLLASDPRLTQTLANCQGDCFEYFRRYDRQPLLSIETCQVFPRPQDDARQRSSHELCHLDGLACGDMNSLSSTLRLPASRPALAYAEAQDCEAVESCTCGISSAQPLHSSQCAAQSRQSIGRLRQGDTQAGFREACESPKHLAQNLKTIFGTLSDAVRDNSSESPILGEFILSRIAYVRKHSRQIYWDLHVFGTNNYLSNGIVNHNSGKSHLFAELMIEAHILDQKRRSVCVREVQKSLAQSVKRLLETKIEAMNAGAYFEVQEAVIKSKKGDGAIIFQGMQNHTADSIKSLEGYDCAWVEEAQSLSQRSLDLLRPTIRKPDSELWFTWNPASAGDPVDNLLRGDNIPPKSIIIPVNYDGNPWFPEVLRAEMEYDRARDPDKYAHVWLGKYLTNSSSRVFKNWRIEEFEAPDDATHRLGADWGFAVDPTTLVRCHVIGRTLYVDYEAYQVGCEIMNTPDLFMTVPEAEKWPIIADSARPETISHMRKNGFPKILAAVKGPKSVQEGIEWLKSYDIIVHPRCTHTIDELTLYSYKTDPLTGQVLPVLQDTKNHVIDALRYACEGMRRAQAAKPHACAPVPNAHRW